VVVNVVGSFRGLCAANKKRQLHAVVSTHNQAPNNTSAHTPCMQITR
jgi:hypothetical protein